MQQALLHSLTMLYGPRHNKASADPVKQAFLAVRYSENSSCRQDALLSAANNLEDEDLATLEMMLPRDNLIELRIIQTTHNNKELFIITPNALARFEKVIERYEEDSFFRTLFVKPPQKITPPYEEAAQRSAGNVWRSRGGNLPHAQEKRICKEILFDYRNIIERMTYEIINKELVSCLSIREERLPDLIGRARDIAQSTLWRQGSLATRTNIFNEKNSLLGPKQQTKIALDLAQGGDASEIIAAEMVEGAVQKRRSPFLNNSFS